MGSCDVTILSLIATVKPWLADFSLSVQRSAWLPGRFDRLTKVAPPGCASMDLLELGCKLKAAIGLKQLLAKGDVRISKVGGNL